MSILKTHLSRCAHVIAARHSIDGCSVGVSGSLVFLCPPRLQGVTSARYWLLGENTPRYRDRFTREFGTKAAKLCFHRNAVGYLRFLFSSCPVIMGQVLGIVYRVISMHLVKKADYSKKTARTGAVTLIRK